MSDPRRSAGRPRQPLPREELIACARAAFAELGFAGASMGEIAGRCGLSKSSLFHHVTSKEALYAEVFSELINDLGGLVARARLEDDGPFLERLDRLGALVTAYLGTRREAAQLLLREFIGDGPFASGAGGDSVVAVLDAAAAFLEHGMSSGVIPAQDPRHLAMSITGLHLLFYATPQVSGRVCGADPFDPNGIETRTVAVLDQVRRLCGAPPQTLAPV